MTNDEVCAAILSAIGALKQELAAARFRACLRAVGRPSARRADAATVSWLEHRLRIQPQRPPEETARRNNGMRRSAGRRRLENPVRALVREGGHPHVGLSHVRSAIRSLAYEAPSLHSCSVCHSMFTVTSQPACLVTSFRKPFLMLCLPACDDTCNPRCSSPTKLTTSHRIDPRP